MERTLLFRAQDPDSDSESFIETKVVRVLERACDPPFVSHQEEGYAPQGHLYTLQDPMTLPDLLQLVRHLRELECPRISAQDVAMLSRGGRLEEQTAEEGE